MELLIFLSQWKNLEKGSQKKLYDVYTKGYLNG